MYFKVTDKENNVFVFRIVRDKYIQNKEKKKAYWRLVNITSGTILFPKFISCNKAKDFLMRIQSWTVEELELEWKFE